MPKNPNLIVSQTSFLPQVMHGTINARTTQDFYNTRALTFVLKKKTKKLQERTFLGETSIMLLIIIIIIIIKRYFLNPFFSLLLFFSITFDS